MTDQNTTTNQMPPDDIDEGLYSRMLYVMGRKAMYQLAGANILISGMRGLGVEIAKNIVLAGVKSVIIYDPNCVSYADLSSQYFFTEKDLGKNRAEVSQPKLAELNNYVDVTSSSEELNEQHLQSINIDVLVLSDGLHERKVILGDYCHKNNIKFIIADTKGLFGQIFCDFGENFEIYDRTGEKPIMQIVTDITNENPGVVFLPSDVRHGFEDGSYVTFSGVKGMSEVNGKEFQISVSNPYTFTIGDTTNFGYYISGGNVTEVKTPLTMHFKSYSESILEPEILLCNYDEADMSGNLHVAFQALSYFKHKYNSTLPKPWDNSDAEKFYELAEEINYKIPDKSITDRLDKNILTIFSKVCTGDLCPIQAVIGGIAAQEIMKAITGKFTPIKQYFYFDAIDCLPKSVYRPSFETTTDNAPVETDISSLKIEMNFSEPININSRYYSQEIVFGNDFQHKLGKAKYFVVGAGAIGCEMLKNFVMMGMGCEPDGKVYVTDMDNIEKSNLNRQFLFRQHNIGQMKSNVAAEAVKQMNNNVNIHAFIEPVGDDTEAIYNDRFFEQLDGVVNALDNVAARKYIDRRCAYHRKPLIDSGTLGTKASVQVVVPFLTDSYSSTKDPPEKLVPMCTIKHFPYLIEHTIEWARDYFEGLFSNSAKMANNYQQDQKKFIEHIKKLKYHQQEEIITNLQQILRSDRLKSSQDCIKWVRKVFEKQFHNNILQLLFNFPHDYLTKNGELFWSGKKRCPHEIKFDVNNKLHMDFIYSASNLYAYMFCLPQLTLKEIQEYTPTLELPEFKPKEGVIIHENDEELRAVAAENDCNQDTIFNEDETYEEIMEKLSTKFGLSKEIVDLKPIEFEKDDDTNFHIDFITAASNLRAENYEIDPVDCSQTKKIAGNIIPAIATTTAMVTGLVCLEVYKLFQKHKHIESYRNYFVNLALPLFNVIEPTSVKINKYLNNEYSLWDRFEINYDMTIEEIVEYFKKEYQLLITFLSTGNDCVIYSEYTQRRKKDIRQDMNKKISEIYRQATKKEIPLHMNSLILDVSCKTLDNNEVIDEMPHIKFTFR